MLGKKKIFCIVIGVLVIILAGLGIWYLVNTRVVEGYNDLALKVAQKREEAWYNSFAPFVYFVEQSEDKITVSLYGTQDYTKLVQIFELNEDKVEKVSNEVHYPTKWAAMVNSLEYQEKEVVDNVVYGISETSSSWIGKTVEEVLQDVDKMYENMQKVEFVK